jgi:iron(III) transport system ATP-binding protein
LIMPEISFVNVSKRFGSVLALDRVSFDVENGEYLCVLGPTGSGKSTLLRLIAGLLRPDDGTIYFGNREMNEVDAQDRNAVYVPQQYALFPHLTVLQNVAFGLLARDSPENAALERARATLEMVRLSSRASAYPSELSGGMQQRVALARGLASGAGLLLLDEPLGALDARLRLDLRHKLRELVKQSGFTAIHVTHDREEAMSVADHIMVVRNGRILDYGTPERVYTKPTGIFAANMIGGANFFEGVVQSTNDKVAIVRVGGGITMHSPPELFTVNEPLILAVRKEKVRISYSEPRLENVLNGEVREVRFLGSSREYLVRLTNGDVVVSRQFLEGPEPAFKVGKRIFVGFEQMDATVFPYPPEGLTKELEVM